MTTTLSRKSFLLLFIAAMLFSVLYMAKPRMNGWKDARSSANVISLATSNGLSIRNCNGDHFVITDPKTGDCVTGYHKKEMSTGVAMQIYKFFVRLGLVK